MCYWSYSWLYRRAWGFNSNIYHEWRKIPTAINHSSSGSWSDLHYDSAALLSLLNLRQERAVEKSLANCDFVIEFNCCLCNWVSVTSWQCVVGSAVLSPHLSWIDGETSRVLLCLKRRKVDTHLRICCLCVKRRQAPSCARIRPVPDLVHTKAMSAYLCPFGDSLPK